MPWIYSYGSGATPPSYLWRGTNYHNQNAAAITVPANRAITKLRAYAAGRNGSVDTRLALWTVNGSNLRQSSTFSMAQGSESGGGQSWHQMDIDPYAVASQTTFWVGLYRNPNTGHIMGTTTSGNGTSYLKTNTASFPSIATMSSADTDSYGAYVGVFVIEPPNAVSSMGVSRTSDTNHTVSWTRNATTDRPYDGIRVERWDNVSGSYSHLNTISGTATSYNDTSTVANRKYRYRVRAENAAGNSAWAYSSYFYTTPAAPTNAAVARVSDTQHTISWTNAQYSADVRTNLRIQRWDNVTGSYYDLKNISGGTATSYSDTTTQADRRYRYRVRAENPGAGSTLVSSYSTTDYIYTTPAKPTNQAAVRDGQDVVISWTNSSTIATAVRLEHQVDGGGYSLLQNLAGNSTNYTHVDPGAGIHQYRVRTEADGRVSAWSETGEVQTMQPPAAPTGLSPNGIAYDITEDRNFTWNYNTVDGTGQTAYELRYREQGETDWVTTGKVVSSTKSHTFSAATFTAGVDYEWQVRTWGQHEDAGPYSASATFKGSLRPVAVVTYPASDEDIHGHPEMEAIWQYSDPQTLAQNAYTVRLYSEADQLLYNFQGSGTAETHTLTYDLQDGVNYKLGVQVRNSDNLWSAETIRLFTVEYEGPPVPGIEVAFDKENATVTIQIYNDEPLEGSPDTVHNRVYRKIDGGATMLIADEVPKNSIVTDYIPGISNENVYFVVAVSDIGSIASSEEGTCFLMPTFPDDPEGEGEMLNTNLQSDYWLNSGPAFSDGTKLIFNMEMQDAFGRETVTRQFAGREYPVSFQGVSKGQTVPISALVPVEQAADIKKVVEDNYGPVCYRDHFGRRFFAAVFNPIFLKDVFGFYRFSCTLIRVEGAE